MDYFVTYYPQHWWRLYPVISDWHSTLKKWRKKNNNFKINVKFFVNYTWTFQYVWGVRTSLHLERTPSPCRGLSCPVKKNKCSWLHLFIDVKFVMIFMLGEKNPQWLWMCLFRWGCLLVILTRTVTGKHKRPTRLAIGCCNHVVWL